MNGILKSTATLALAGVLLLAASSPVNAQMRGRDLTKPPGEETSTTDGVERPKPPRPDAPKAPSPLISYGILVLICAGLIGVGLIPSKRTHQD